MVLGMNRKLWTMLLGKDLNREAWPSGLGLASCTRLLLVFLSSIIIPRALE